MGNLQGTSGLGQMGVVTDHIKKRESLPVSWTDPNSLYLKNKLRTGMCSPN